MNKVTTGNKTCGFEVFIPNLTLLILTLIRTKTNGRREIDIAYEGKFNVLEIAQVLNLLEGLVSLEVCHRK